MFFKAININQDSRPVFMRWGIYTEKRDSTLSSDKTSWFLFHSLTGDLFLRHKSRWDFAGHESEKSTVEARTETDVEGKKSPQVISYIPKNS